MLGLLYRAADALRHRCDHGQLGEDLAHRYLRRKGCTIVARNYRTRSGSGEIDVVAWHRGKLVFVEVKTRGGAAHGEPETAIDSEKRARLRIAARDYVRRAGVAWDQTRFDIVTVLLDKPRRIEWTQDAFGQAEENPRGWL